MLALCPTGQTMSHLFMNEFLLRMPATVCGHLHTFAYEDPQALAQQADLFWSSHHSQTIHQISKDDINLSTEELACNSVNHPSKKKEYSERSRYENYNSSSTSRWCFYHQKYGKKARKCTRSLFLFIKFGKRSNQWEKINLNSFSARIKTKSRS